MEKQKHYPDIFQKKNNCENISIEFITNKVQKPSNIEIKKNPNSRSAKLRVIKKLRIQLLI